MVSDLSGARVAAGSRIRLHFSLALDDGDVVDSNFDGQPATCVVGDGSLPEGFEQLLLGLGAGARERFVVPPEQAFGPHREDNVQVFKRGRFAGMMLQEGLVVSFADAASAELPGVVTAIDGERVTVDFNHPLAGKTLVFQVHIIDVE
jgi:FKBP-type peptidyl-prolyl cis-trans isomerase SlpA